MGGTSWRQKSATWYLKDCQTTIKIISYIFWSGITREFVLLCVSEWQAPPWTVNSSPWRYQDRSSFLSTFSWNSKLNLSETYQSADDNFRFFFDLSSFERDLQSRKSPSLLMGWTLTMTIYNSLPPILKMKSHLPIQLITSSPRAEWEIMIILQVVMCNSYFFAQKSRTL